MSPMHANPSIQSGGLLTRQFPQQSSRTHGVPLPKLSSLPISKPSSRSLKSSLSSSQRRLPYLRSPFESHQTVPFITPGNEIRNLQLPLPPLLTPPLNFEHEPPQQQPKQRPTLSSLDSPVPSSVNSSIPNPVNNSQYPKGIATSSPQLILPLPTETTGPSHDSLIRRLREFTTPPEIANVAVPQLHQFKNEANIDYAQDSNMVSGGSHWQQQNFKPQELEKPKSTLRALIPIHPQSSLLPNTPPVPSLIPVSPLTPPQRTTNIDVPADNYRFVSNSTNIAVPRPICPVTDLSALSKKENSNAHPCSNDLNECNIVNNNDERPFACQKCNATFRRKDNLTAHVKAQHKGERPFRCDVCGFRFIKKDHAMKHWKVVHLKERPFVCNHCDSRFGQRSDLNKHFRSVHLRIKPFECQHCGLRFSHRGNQIRHQAVVHEKRKPFSCTSCSFTFAEKSNLLKHCHAVHKMSSPIIHSNRSSTSSLQITTSIASTTRLQQPNQPIVDSRTVFIDPIISSSLN